MWIFLHTGNIFPILYTKYVANNHRVMLKREFPGIFSPRHDVNM